METEVKYQAQDLVSALFKVKKYQSNNYEELYKDLQGQCIMLNMLRTNFMIIMIKFVMMMRTSNYNWDGNNQEKGDENVYDDYSCRHFQP